MWVSASILWNDWRFFFKVARSSIGEGECMEGTEAPFSRGAALQTHVLGFTSMLLFGFGARGWKTSSCVCFYGWNAV